MSISERLATAPGARTNNRSAMDIWVDTLTPEHHIRRRLDWTEPLVEGDHQLNPTIAGDD